MDAERNPESLAFWEVYPQYDGPDVYVCNYLLNIAVKVTGRSYGRAYAIRDLLNRVYKDG